MLSQESRESLAYVLKKMAAELQAADTKVEQLRGDLADSENAAADLRRRMTAIRTDLAA